ncbi:MAG TPA: septal ring lytic transglycosylase RlpA family protein [Methylophilus sp.]
MTMIKHLTLALVASLMVACSSTPTQPTPASSQVPNTPASSPSATQQPSANADPAAQTASKPGGYYLDDGPEANPPTNLDEIPDAEPKKEPLNTFTNKPYVALGETYVPMTSYKPFSQSGIASWYGKRFHGRKTASGEAYNMYAMTAAHPTLPLPSYVKVTNPSNNRSVIVRINDRGPFKHSRIIDLSYAAAHKLRIIERGSAPVSIEAVDVEAYSAQTKASKLQMSSSLTSTEQQSAQTPLQTVQKAVTQFFVQAGAYKLESNAAALQQKIQKLGIANSRDIQHVYNNQLYRIKLGPYATQSKAQQVAAEIRKKLSISAVIRTQ